MIIQEIVIVNNMRLKHTYSSTRKLIQQEETGVIYSEAYDTLKRDYHYIETEHEIEEVESLDKKLDEKVESIISC